MTSLRGWETAWLDWARPIVCMSDENPSHLKWCRDTLGPAEYPEDNPTDPACDPTLRWPGYVGKRWVPGRGVLFVGSVHSDFTRDGGRHGDAKRVATVATMAAANTQWREGVRNDRQDREYLNRTREAYASLIPGWARDGAFGEVREQLGDSVDEIAWTNLAHCRAQPRKTPRGEYVLQIACSGKTGQYPIAALVEALRPAAILAAILPLEKRHGKRFSFARPGGDAPLLWAFNGANGKRDGLAPDDWAHQFAAAVQSVRGT